MGRTQRRGLGDRARQSAERAAYAAVGAPTVVLKALSARVSELRDTVKRSQNQMSSELAGELDEWVSEGEHVVERAMRHLRESAVAEELRAAVRTGTRTARTGLDKAAQSTRSPLGLPEPAQPLTAITGIGPRYEEQLRRAGVTGIPSFLDRTSTRQGVEELGASIGVSPSTLLSWRDQVDLSRIDRVGDSYEQLLHRAGVWTLAQMAGEDTSELVERIRSVATPDAPEQLPTRLLVERWQAAARGL